MILLDLRRAAALPPGRLLFLAELALTASVMPAWVRLRPLAALTAWESRSTAPEEELQACLDLAEALWRRPGFRRISCLCRSLALGRVLARRGWTTRLRIGVSRRAEALDAHAWLERSGRPLGEDGSRAGAYAPFPA